MELKNQAIQDGATALAHCFIFCLMELCAEHWSAANIHVLLL
jgi:hypothetical protein